MPANIEVKARVKDFEALQRVAEALSDGAVEIIPQEDTFFHIPLGRLKLRTLAPDLGTLIFYQRPDQEFQQPVSDLTVPCPQSSASCAGSILNSERLSR